ncbi:MAG TPA: hypothetical protein VEW05_05325 [Candidatus Polarisedimenticolia bacterium]|nr:hypothetical protein [Candidatus Polarisedimenticolia bacterium]
MPIPWDADILIFALTTAKIVLGGKKRLRESKRAIAVHDEMQEIREDALTKAQKEYIRPFDEQLAKLNYFRDFTYCVTNHRNYGQNLIRRYTNPTDSGSCTLMIVELKVKVGDVESITTSSSVAFRTRFASGKHLTTRNMSRKSLMDHPPHSIVQECRHTTNLPELNRRHEARAAELGLALSPPSGPEAIMEEHQREHKRFCEYQLERGILRLLPDGEAYEVTDKTRARGIWNHYNPFAKRLSLKELLLAALVGSFLPLFGILKLAPLVTGRLQGTGLSLLPLPWLPIGVCYALAGFIIGIISDRASFQWMMLVCYVPAHFIAGWSFGAAPYSTMAFLISFYVIRMKRRRALIFQS